MMNRKRFIKTMVSGVVGIYGTSVFGINADPVISGNPNRTKINVIGVGDGGCGIVNLAAQDRTNDVQYIAIIDGKSNLDSFAVDEVYCHAPSSASEKTTNHKFNRSSTIDRSLIKEITGKPEFLFVVCDFGWRHEVSIALSIAEVTIRRNICTTVFAVTPAHFEGVFRRVASNSGLEWLDRLESDFDVNAMVYSREEMFEQSEDLFSPAHSLEDKFNITNEYVGSELIHMVDIFKHFFQANGSSFSCV